MLEKFIISQITRQLPFVPNEGQEKVIAQLADFITSLTPRKTFLLRGYAGTGKTSLISALVGAMNQMQQNTVLLAPTGRAAKVMSHYAGVNAFTIHKWIYRGEQTGQAELQDGQFSLADNRMQHTLFIVDEASMISADRDNTAFGTGSLLDDLIRFVFQCTDNQTVPTNALLLVGDDAQLPPVGHTLSPALNADFLQGYGLDVSSATLTQVARQALDSGILKNATRVREDANLTITEENDVHLLAPQDFLEALENSYREVGLAETIILTRSNKRTNLYNQGVRTRILYREDALSVGDRLMVSKNNYFWTKDYEGLSFLANGDTMEVVRLRNEREMYGLHFIDASLQSLDYDWEIDVTLLMESLTTPSPADSYALVSQLYERIAEDYPEIRNKKERDQLIRQSPYYNALQVRFAYAVTCHKAQGGQWAHVYVDAGQPLPDEDERSRQRWTYTALTRAQEQLYWLHLPSSRNTD